jgi:hypothetical protein
VKYKTLSPCGGKTLMGFFIDDVIVNSFLMLYLARHSPNDNESIVTENSNPED